MSISLPVSFTKGVEKSKLSVEKAAKSNVSVEKERLR
jgi:hypothetical protein